MTHVVYYGSRNMQDFAQIFNDFYYNSRITPEGGGLYGSLNFNFCHLRGGYTRYDGVIRETLQAVPKGATSLG
jgi:hypothetical protein